MNTPSGQLQRNRRHLTSSVDQTPDVCVPHPVQPVEKPEDGSAGVTNEAEARKYKSSCNQGNRKQTTCTTQESNQHTVTNWHSNQTT